MLLEEVMWNDAEANSRIHMRNYNLTLPNASQTNVFGSDGVCAHFGTKERLDGNFAWTLCHRSVLLLTP
jgi:hypothetical protein